MMWGWVREGGANWDGCQLGGKSHKKPFSDRPELDVSAVLGTKEASYYQSLIGVLRWIVELGRVDICIECSMMSSYVTMPRVGQLEQVLQIFGYLKDHHNAEMVFDPTPQEIDHDAFQRKDWSTSEFGHLEQRKRFLLILLNPEELVSKSLQKSMPIMVLIP